MPNVLRLRARDGKLYPHLQNQEAGRRSFIGHKFQVIAKGPADDGSLDAWGFAPTGEVVEVPADEHAVEYAKACADGGLMPADAETAAFLSRFVGRSLAVDAAASSAPKPAAQKGSAQ